MASRRLVMEQITIALMKISLVQNDMHFYSSVCLRRNDGFER